METQEQEKLWENLAKSLTLYFIYGDKNSYDDFDKLFNQHFEFDITEEKFKKMIDTVGGMEYVEKNGGLSPNEYIQKLFKNRRMFNSDYEREFQTVLGGCKFCYKLKGI